MEKLFSAGYPVPRVLLLEAEHSPIDRPFIIMEYIVITSYSIHYTKLYEAAATDINNFPLLDELECKNAWDEKEREVCYIGSIAQIRGIKELVRSYNFV